MLMRILAGFAVTTLLVMLSTAASADDWRDCTNVYSPDLGIPSCTRIINSGRESTKKLAYAYSKRATAYYMRCFPRCDQKGNADLDHAIAELALDLPKNITLDQKANIDILVRDAQGNPIDAVIPIEVTITDAKGRLAEFSGFYGAKNGRQNITLDIASNDPVGQWTVTVNDLASGKSTTSTFQVVTPTFQFTE